MKDVFIWKKHLLNFLSISQTSTLLLCHDILEDAWKEQPSYSKQDAIVSLILFTTASYHHRRHNYKGALKVIKSTSYDMQCGRNTSITIKH